MQEFADFLAKQPPFDALTTNDIERLARNIEVEYFGAGTVIVTAGSTPLDRIYLVRTGAVEVLDRGNVVDLLGPGDAFGHVSVLSGLPPELTFRAAEDTLCYRLPDPRLIVHDASALQFSHFGTVLTRHRLTASALMSDTQSSVTHYLRPIVWSEASASVRDVAKAITEAEQSCALIKFDGGLGLVTDRDFRSRVGIGEISVDAPISAIMSSPVITVPVSFTLAEAFLRMVGSGVHHLVVVDDYQKPVGVVRAMDLASVELRNPLLIRAAIESSRNVDELAEASRFLLPSIVELHDSGVPALHVGALIAVIVEAILTRLLALSDEGYSPVARSWLILGSMARGEPLPISDVDTAIAWADPLDESNPADAIRESASRVLDQMERCELHRCPDGANADNPLFSRSKSSWVAVARTWITEPTREGALLLSSIVADSRPITHPTIGRAITDTIRATTRSNEYLNWLLRFTLAKKPPVGFVRDFVIEHSGEHRGDLDLKRGGLTPVCALARWLAIASGDVHGGTIDRLKRAASGGLLTDDEADVLIGAFKDVYQLAFEQEVAAIKSGRTGSSWVAPQHLDSLTRRHLRESFRSIAAVQTRVENDWQTRLS